jgi:hypothetical protein
MRCIFCLQERPPSLEHIFPLAIGGSLVIDRVCETCNSTLGNTVDTYLTTHPIIVARRAQLKLAGNSRTVPDPFRALFGQGQLDDGSGQRVRAYSGPDGRLIAHLIYQEREYLGENGANMRQISLDARDSDKLPKIISRQRKREGKPPLSDQEMDTTVAEVLANRHTLDRPQIHGQMLVDIARYKLGVLKIAYELIFRWCGDSFVDSELAHRMRNVITGETSLASGGLRGAIQFRLNPILSRWPGDAHVALCMQIGSKTVLLLRIFRSISALIDLEGAILPDGPRFLSVDPVRIGITEGAAGPELFRIDLANFRSALRRCTYLRPVFLLPRGSQ